jgi:hypothetical protein
VTYGFDGFHGRALYELNGLPEKVRDGPLLERLRASAPFRVCSVNGD